MTTPSELLASRADANHDDIIELRREMNAGLIRILDKLELMGKMCSTECVKTFASKKEVEILDRKVIWTVRALTLFALMFLFTHKNEAIEVLGDVLRLRFF